MATAMSKSLSRRPGGRFAEWTDAIEDDPPELESSKRVITAPLPRVDPSASATTPSSATSSSATTTAPLGRRVAGYPAASTSGALSSANDKPSDPAASTGSAEAPPIEIEKDDLADALLGKLPSPLRADPTATQPGGFALSAGPATPPPSLGAPPPTASILVTDSVLKGRPVDPNRAVVTAVSSRRKHRMDEVEVRADDEPEARPEATPPLTLAEKERRTKTRILVGWAAAGLVFLVGFGLMMRAMGFFEPLPPAARRVSEHSPPVLARETPPASAPSQVAPPEESAAETAPSTSHETPETMVHRASTPAAPRRPARAPSPAASEPMQPPPAASTPEEEEEFDGKMRVRVKGKGK
jgi:hypothetical protein